jgi:small subunit ribosomal protein S8
MVNDIVSDLLTRIRNSGQRNTKQLTAPLSKMSKSILEILKNENFIEDYEVVENELLITLKYVNGQPVIAHLERVSKPGLRNYVGYKDIPKVLNGMGICILSTSKGVMTGTKAKLEKVGGELICKIW